MNDPLTCWVASEGHAGMENQCLGLAEAVGLPHRVLRLYPRRPWTWLPPGRWPAPLAALKPDSDRIGPPWPRLMITCGRRSVPYALYVKRQSAGATFTVHIQDPRTNPARLDLVAVPAHDRLTGDNVVTTVGALHRITAPRLRAAADATAARLQHLPRPLVAVLIGGTNSCYQMTPDIIRRLARQLATLAGQGVGLAITPSRRTGEENIAALRQELAGLPAEIWDFKGDNPYFGYLGLADAVIVTCDSVSMVSEACATGKPVHVVELAGGNTKFRAFHDSMRKRGYTRPFQGRLDRWTYDPLDDTAAVAARILERMASAT